MYNKYKVCIQKIVNWAYFHNLWVLELKNKLIVIPINFNEIPIVKVHFFRPAAFCTKKFVFYKGICKRENLVKKHVNIANVYTLR